MRRKKPDRDDWNFPGKEDPWGLERDNWADESWGSTPKRVAVQRRFIMLAVALILASLGLFLCFASARIPLFEPSNESIDPPLAISVDASVIVGQQATKLAEAPSPTSTAAAIAVRPTAQIDVTEIAGTGLQAEDVFEPTRLAAFMLDLINRDRAASGLASVGWDETAAQAALLHAQDMVSRDYFSHWNPEGLGPDHRYSFLGGEHMAMENLFEFQYTFGDGRGAPVEDWIAVIEQGQIGLMNSPGHRRNILDPAHTHVGIGMAYDESTGQFRLAQEFVNQYVDLRTPLPAQVTLGEEVRVEGAFREGLLSNALLDIAFEPFPQPLSMQDLEQTSTYTSAAESLGDTRRIGLEFDERVTLDYGAGPGLYHIRIFVDLPTGQAQVVDHVVVAQ